MPRKPKAPVARKGRKKKQEIVGDGLFDIIQPRNAYNNVSTRTLNDLGGYIITNMVLSRAPVRSFLRRAVNAITFGKFEDSLRKYGFDKVFHLSMICDVEQNGIIRRVVIEKNAVVNISTAYKQEPEAEYFRVQLPIANRITLKELMTKTQQRMGTNYFPYNAFNNNCQIFIDNVLDANDLNSPEAHSWLFQDMTKVADEIPEVSKKAIDAITHVGAVSDKLLGNGKNQPSEFEMLIQKMIMEVR
jgi:hypothetical protein